MHGFFFSLLSSGFFFFDKDFINEIGMEKGRLEVLLTGCLLVLIGAGLCHLVFPFEFAQMEVEQYNLLLRNSNKF